MHERGSARKYEGSLAENCRRDGTKLQDPTLESCRDVASRGGAWCNTVGGSGGGVCDNVDGDGG